MFQDSVIYYPPVRAQTSTGAPVTTRGSGVAVVATVQKSDVVMIGAFVHSDHEVRMPEYLGVEPEGEFDWTPRSGPVHTLIARGHPEPSGQGDVVWIVPCLEVR